MLLKWRAEARKELERLPPGSTDHAALTCLYDNSTAEIDNRARRAWSQVS